MKLHESLQTIIEEIRSRFFDLSAVVAIIVAGYHRYLVLRTLDPVEYIDYFMNYAPNAYRLTTRFLVALTSDPFQYYYLIVLEFIVASVCVYYLIRPTGRDFVLFLLWVLVLEVYAYSIQVLLLVLLVKHKHKWYSILYLIALAPIKEFAVWLGGGYLLLDGEKPIWQTLTGIGVATAIYLYIRLILVGEASYHPGSAPFITLGYTLTRLHTGILFGRLLPVLFLIFFTVEDWFDLKVMLWNLIPLPFLALIWEEQLWLPAAMVILAHRKLRKEAEDYGEEDTRGPDFFPKS